VKLLIDAQLPRRLVRQLREQGIDAIHTLDLPSGNRFPQGTSQTMNLPPCCCQRCQR